MCGYGIGTIFQVAIFVIVVLVVLALLRAAFGNFFASITSAPYWNIIQIVIAGVVAILILLFIWRLAECAGLFGRYSMLSTQLSMMVLLPGRRVEGAASVRTLRRPLLRWR